MTGVELIAAVGAIVGLVGQVPSLVQSFEELIALIKGHGELTPEQRAELLGQLASVAAKVAAYRPRPPAGSAF